MNKTTKRLLFCGAIAVVVLSVIIGVIACNRAGKDKEYIDKATAARILILLDGNTSNVPTFYAMNHKDGWILPYMEAFEKKTGVDWTDKEREEFAAEPFTYGELQAYLDEFSVDYYDLNRETKIKVSKKKKNAKVLAEDFETIYDYLVDEYGEAKGVSKQGLTIVAVSSTMEYAQHKEYGEWKVVTNFGTYLLEGIDLSRYCDATVMAVCKGDRIISVENIVSKEVEYKNVWVESISENYARAYVFGIWRRYECANTMPDMNYAIADINIVDGKINNAAQNKNFISGKVSRISMEYVELEDMGGYSFDKGCRIYDTRGDIKYSSVDAITVGYDLADYYLSDGKVCAIVINRDLEVDNIRVMIMNTGYETIMHDQISLVSPYGMRIHYAGTYYDIDPDVVLDITVDSKYLAEGRIRITPNDAEGRIQILSVERSYGNPEYEGTIEIANIDGRLTLINELPLDDYLRYVVPSEMPVKFGVEALKVQAVCARSYAYMHINNNSLRVYGGHVDDSVSYQVYNNIRSQYNSDVAVKATVGQVLTRKGQVVTAYYYSTSCGHTSDITLWSEGGEEYDMYTAKNVNPEGQHTDLSDETSFREFIDRKNGTDFDYEFTYYRWNTFVPIEDISTRANEYIMSRHRSEPNKILISDGLGGWHSEEEPYVGQVTGLEVVERSSGGAIKKLVIRGTENDALIIGELNIRYVLGPGSNVINTNTDTQTTFYILPSAYFYADAVYEDGKLIGYTYIGGGYGHGIGMSQNAVSAMTKSGMRYDEIIDFFYENVNISIIY